MARSSGPSAAALRYYQEQQAKRAAAAQEQQAKGDLARQFPSPSTSSNSSSSASQGEDGPTGTGPSKFPRFQPHQVSLGALLGHGGFCSVYEIKAFAIGQQKQEKQLFVPQKADKAFLARHCLRSNGEARFVLKQVKQGTTSPTSTILKSKNVQQKNQYRERQGMMDLQVELHILGKLCHPHIVKLRATVVGVDRNLQGLVLDHLYGTLEDRLAFWKAKHAAYTGLRGNLNDRKGAKKLGLYQDRLQTAREIATALAYMHKRDVLYRDLKPENCGYNATGQVQLFDFGLAKDISSLTANADSTYNLTAQSGSLRYMAPEVANGLCYNDTCDVYSFGILFWQLLTLQDPYELYTPQTLREKVYNGLHKRPPLKDDMTENIQLFLDRCWHKNLLHRPSMQTVVDCVDNELAAFQKCISAFSGTGVNAGRPTMGSRQTSLIFPVETGDDDNSEEGGKDEKSDNVQVDDSHQDFSCSSDTKRLRSLSMEDGTYHDDDEDNDETTDDLVEVCLVSLDTKRQKPTPTDGDCIIIPNEPALVGETAFVSNKLKPHGLDGEKSGRAQVVESEGQSSFDKQPALHAMGCPDSMYFL